ncbi:MAG: ChaB family protein [Pseudonocardia sp.]|nr:ChaB family protein [Pseudonocardia sp.]
MRDDVPATIARSDDKAVRTYKKALDSAEDTYGPGERAHRVAYAALKHTHEKVGDHWEPKERWGPSDERAEQGGAPGAVEHLAPTAQGVDARASKGHLEDVATRVGIEHPEKLHKAELIDAIEKANARETRRSRGQ